MLLLAQVNYGPCICCEPVIYAQISRYHFNTVALCDCVRHGERKRICAICLIHVYVCTDMHVCLPTPPTSKPQMPEGQTSRRCASLLVPVAGTEWSEEESSVAPSDGLILTPTVYPSCLKASVVAALRSGFMHTSGRLHCEKRNTVCHIIGAPSSKTEYKLCFCFRFKVWKCISAGEQNRGRALANPNSLHHPHRHTNT